jgi:hypothetical protein
MLCTTYCRSSDIKLDNARLQQKHKIFGVVYNFNQEQTGPICTMCNWTLLKYTNSTLSEKFQQHLDTAK